MPGRVFNSSLYRYGFNGKENDNEVKGEGNQQDYGMRIYDPRVGRFLSVDPLTKDYPMLTPYQFAGNKPIFALDLDGAEELPYWEKAESRNTAEHVGNFLYNSIGSLYNGVAGTWNTVVGYARTSANDGFVGVVNKLNSDYKNLKTAVVNGVTNTKASDFTNPENYWNAAEDFTGFLLTRKIVTNASTSKTFLNTENKVSTVNNVLKPVETQKILPNSTSKVAAAKQKLAVAAKGTQGNGIFIVSESGATISTSQSRMIESFTNAGFPTFQTQSPGIGFTLPNGNSVRAMQPSGGAPLRTSFENIKGHPVNIDGKTVNPPKGTTNTKQYVRDRTHITQTQ